MKKIIILSFILILSACSKGPETISLNLEEAKAKTLDFINNSLMQPGQEVSIKEVVEDAGMYKVVVNMSNGQEIESYLSRDGKKFFPQVMDIAEIEKQAQEAQANSTQNQAKTVDNVPKAEKAKVELFVMSFCPYGVIAENAMAPVFDLLGEKADINVRFIASIQTDDINDVKSLHGAIEGIEDTRQLCVEKNYGKEVLWKYISEINEKCYPIYSKGEDVYKTCWQTAAKNAGMSTAKLDQCVNDEGVALIKKEDEAAKAYGVTGSPSLIINGAKINASRSPEGFKTAVCNGFENPPAECETILSEDGGQASGGCG